MRAFVLLLLSIVACFGQVQNGPLRVYYNPANEATIKFWLDAGTITGVSDGSNIAKTDWSDRSQSALGSLASCSNAVYRADAGNGKPAIEFNGSNSYCKTPSFAVAQPMTVFMVVKGLSYVFNTRYLDGNTVNKVVLAQSVATNDFPIAMWAGTAYTPADRTQYTNMFTLIEAHYNGASSFLMSNKNGPQTANPGSNGFTDGATLATAGGLNAGFFCNCQIAEFIVCNSNLTARSRALLRQYLTQKHKLITESGFCFDGNSLTSGTGSTGGNDYPSQLMNVMGTTNYWFKFNLGVSGQTTVQMQADAATQVDPLIRSFSRRLLAAWEITNDITVSNATDTVAENNWLNYCTNRQNAGWTVITLTVIARTNFTAQMRTYADNVNTWMRTNWQSFSSALADVAADPRLSDFSDTNYFSTDGIHLNNAGYAIVASTVLTQALKFPYP